MAVPDRWPATTPAGQHVGLEILIHGPISRTEIARRLDLSQGALTKLTTPLLEAGLVSEGEQRAEARAGRRSRPLEVVAQARHFIGVKLTGSEVVAALCNLRADVEATLTLPLESHDPSHVADAVAQAARRVAGDTEITQVGVGIGALVDGAGTVITAPFLEWTDVALGPLLRAHTGLPVVIENDVVAYTESEHWFGAGRGLDRFAVLTVGVGIGYGAVVGGQILVGPDSGIGLVGHWPVQDGGPLCPEGHRGCAQAVVAMPSIARETSRALDRDLSYAQALDLAESGNPAARRVVDEAGLGLGRLIAAVGNLVVPQRVILGGEGIALAHVAADAIARGIARDRSPRASSLELTINDADDIRWARGAAVVAIQSYVLGSAQ